MTKLEALIGLNMVCDIGSIRLNKLLRFFHQPENILKAPVDKLNAVSGIGEKIAHEITSLKKEDIDKEFSLAQKLGLKILTPQDAGYPENLKNIPDPPIVLYVKGQIEEKDKFSIAIVGSRRASFYGLSCAERFAQDLSGLGFTIISGMARGIDTASHRGALKAGGRTLAVMGGGFQHIYPPENKSLLEEISENGAVISEFPIEVEPLKQNFPRRNRVISGLSLGVLVVEAARNSGALITADFALEQGRDVFALPGKVDSGNSFGTNGLIQQGAKLVSCANDIMEEFNLVNSGKPFLNADLRKSSATRISGSAKIFGGNADTRRIHDQDNLRLSACNLRPSALKENLSGEESFLYGLISEQPATLDEIVEKANTDIAKISSTLLKLQMRKLIKELPGKQFVRTTP